MALVFFFLSTTRSNDSKWINFCVVLRKNGKIKSWFAKAKHVSKNPKFCFTFRSRQDKWIYKSSKNTLDFILFNWECHEYETKRYKNIKIFFVYYYLWVEQSPRSLFLKCVHFKISCLRSFFVFFPSLFSFTVKLSYSIFRFRMKKFINIFVCIYLTRWMEYLKRKCM